jgi:hypothetical protein
MIRRLSSQARDLATWPLRLGFELLELPTTLRNIRKASYQVGPAIDQVSQFAGRADEMVTEMDRTLADVGGMAKTLGALTSQAKMVNDQWRRTMGRMPIVGRVAAELERTAAQLAAADEDVPPADDAG